MTPMFNVSCRKIGGIWFIRLGRIGFTFWVSREARDPVRRAELAIDDALRASDHRISTRGLQAARDMTRFG